MKASTISVRFVIGLTALLICLIALEGLFRIVRKDDALKLSMGRTDTRYHHALPPHAAFRMVSSAPGEYDATAHVNRFGFRGPDFELEKKPGQRRVFLAGDSFTFGVGCGDEETISSRMQEILDPAGDAIQIVNVGRGSYSPLIHYLLLRDILPQFKPDLVALLLDFTDLWDDWNMEKHLRYGPGGALTGANPYYEYGRFQLWNFLRAHSVLCAYLHNKVVRTFSKIRKLGLKGYLTAKLEGKKSKVVIAASQGDTIEYDGRLFLRGKEKADEIRAHFKRTAQYILRTKDAVESQGGRLILVMYPYGIHVGPDQWSEGRTSWGFEKNKVYTDLFAFDLAAQFARENGIPFVNLLDDFLRHKDEQLFFPNDGHFTPAANRVTAEALARHPVILAELKRS